MATADKRPSSWKPSPPPPIQTLRLQGHFSGLCFCFFKTGISQPLGDAAPRLQGLRIVQNLE